MTGSDQKKSFHNHFLQQQNHPTMTKTSTTIKKTTTGTTATTMETSTTTITTTRPTKLRKLNWTRPNYKGIYHDNRRLLEHRAKNCECHVCYRELHKLPPVETFTEKYAARNAKLAEQEIKRAKKKAKKDIKAGKQASIQTFFK
jgi:hypothetical protein